MRLLSALLFGFSALLTPAQPGGLCDGLNAGFSHVHSGGGYQFSNATTGTGISTTWVWNFGDGTTSNNPQPFHEFPGTGTYEVCLMAISIFMVEQQPFTCVDSACVSITVGGGDPCDDFEACFVPSQTGPGMVFFNNCTNPGVNTQYVWSFGDGSMGSGVAPTHTYAEPGSYVVCLTAYWNSCVDSTCTTIIVEGGDDPCDELEAGFTFTTSPNGVQFSNTTTGTGTTTTWLWIFDDGTTSDNAQPFHTFPVPGIYEVCLKALSTYTNDNGATITCSDTYCANVTWQGGDPCDDFEACFVTNDLGDGAFFFDNCTGQNNAQFVWNFGDGTTSAVENAEHVYQQPGTYTVCLTAYWENCVDSTCTTVVVEDVGDPCDSLSASFWWEIGGIPGSIFYSATTGTGPNWIWSFGDGTFSDNGPQGIHTYSKPGVYQLCLTVFANIPGTQDTCSVTSCQWVTIGGGDPCGDFDATITANPVVGTNTVVFSSTTTLPASGMIWYFGDGTEGFGQTVTHIYDEPGQYHVCLAAWYWNQQIQDSCWTETCIFVTVGDGDPCGALDAGFTAVVGGLSVNIQNAVLNNQWAYSWTFGDGTSGGGFNPFHTYTSAGTYQVCLLVWTWDPVAQDTCFADHCEWITVGSEPCDDFEACFVPNDLGDGVFFFDNCTGQNNAQFVWNFGDGSTSSVVNAEHVYDEPGIYTVCLTAYWQNCIDSTCTTIIVEGGGDPCDGFVATITWNPSGNNSATFVGTTNPPASSLIWYFGDGTQGFGQNATHTYSAPGQYHVCLVAWYWNQQIQDSCWTEACTWITVGTGSPCDGLNANFTTALNGLLVNFQNAMVNPQWSYYWTFGDGSSGVGPNPSHIYSGPGTYNVCLTVWSWDPIEQDTCFADHCMWLTIGGDPCDELDACFGIDPISATAFQFLNCTTPEVGVQFVWHFGDGSMGSGVSPDHAYQEPGVYTVCLIAYWQDCMDSTCTTLTVGNGTPCDNDFEADFTWTSQGTATIFHGTTNLPPNGLMWFFGDGTTGSGEVITHLYEPPGPYNVCLAAWYWNPQTQDTCWAEHCELIDPFDPTNGIVDADLTGIRIYPQPATDVITIEGMDASAQLRLFGSDGRMILQERAQGAVHHLDVSDLATGVYVLHLDIDGRAARYRIAVE